MAAMTPLNAMVEPTDMSKPPATMTNIMPKERMPLMDTCFKMLTRLLGLMKLGLSMASTITTTRKMIKMKYLLIRAFAPLLSPLVSFMSLIPTFFKLELPRPGP